MEEKRPYIVWTVDGQEYKLKLTTAAIMQLETKYKRNLIGLVTEGDIPELSVMLTVTHAAMTKYHTKMKLNDVVELFDQYLEEDGSQTAYLTDVFIPLFQVSGFFYPTTAKTVMMAGNPHKA